MLYSCTPDAAAKIAQAGLFQKAVAARVGISHYTLRNKLHRGHYTRDTTAHQIARVYAQATGSSEQQAFNALFEAVCEPSRYTSAIYIATEAFAALLIQARLTQALLARQAGLNPALVNRILRQRQTVSGRLAWKLACAYASTCHTSAEQAFAQLFTSAVVER